MFYNKEQKQRGFTLIELLIYIAISGIVIGAVTSYFFNLMKTYRLVENLVLVANNQSLLFEKLNFDVRYTEDVDDVNSVFDNDNGVLTIIKDSDSYSYSLSDGMIMKSVNAGGSTAITSNDVCVTAFQIRKINTAQGKEGVNVLVTMEGQSSGGGGITKTTDSDIFVRERTIDY